jgi:hypothetical protein
MLDFYATAKGKRAARNTLHAEAANREMKSSSEGEITHRPRYLTPPRGLYCPTLKSQPSLYPSI